MKRFAIFIAGLLMALSATAQVPTGGVTGRVVDRQGRVPVAGARLTLSQNGATIGSLTSSEDGKFLFEGLENGMYDMKVTADGYLDAMINVTVDKGFVKDLFFVTLTSSGILSEASLDDNLIDGDMLDSGYSDNPTILFDANDAFTSMVGYGFSAIRFKNRGYNSESQDVLLAGIRLNDAITGYSPYSLWSGLNEAMRSKESSNGLESAHWALGRYNGVTNIFATPSQMRKGWRFSALSNSALYRLRLMGSYASGELDNGISYAFNISARLGGNDWIQGVYYRYFAYYAGIGKNFGDGHRLTLATFATPGERGAQNASTQEVYDLMGDNMYNSNWGYQGGKMRNARVRRTFEPITFLNYSFEREDGFEIGATAMVRLGFNGYSALDWYDAADPRPDYYRNLPSYAWMEDDDYGRLNTEKYDWAKEMWSQRGGGYDNYQHINWDRMYEVNRNSDGGRSKYALEERHTDQKDFNLAINVGDRPTRFYSYEAGLHGRFNKASNYKQMKDLLGGKYFLNIDQFAERDFGASEAMVQNDLDYFMKHGAAERIGEGGRYGYDYNSYVRYSTLWLNNKFDFGRLTFNFGGSYGMNTIWREGLMRKGLFAGKDDSGNDIIVNGVNLTRYDSNGNLITSKGESEKLRFDTWSAKGSIAYVAGGNHRISANGGYFSDAPTFNQAFTSARTRNTVNPNLTNTRTLSSDINYQYSAGGANIRLTAFYTKIFDRCNVTSFYDDSQKSFTNFAMSGIDQRHLGVEFGARVPLFTEGLTASGVFAWGDYRYTSTPMMTQTIDNSAEILADNIPVEYWKSHPVYKKGVLDDGSTGYLTDSQGNYIVEKEVPHFVGGTPSLAAALALNYRTRSYWFFELNGQYFAKSYLDMNPLYRTNMACGGPDGVASPAEIEYMAQQEELAPSFLVNASIGKSWYINRKYNFGFSLELKNLLNNREVVTGGYEQTRLITSSTYDRYYKFDQKYFYMSGFNYMLNLYFRF